MSDLNIPPVPKIGSLESSPTRTALSPENDRFLRDYIHRESGILLGEDKDYLLHTRLAPVLTREKLSSLDELCMRLRLPHTHDFRRGVVEAITTHETLFFRDAQVYEALRTVILPELAEARKSTRMIRIWSAACSSGQEPYSLAMMLCELGYADWNIEILATDISSTILERASSGRYHRIEVNRGLPAPMLVKYFDRVENEWQVRPQLRKMIRFQHFDLRQDMRTLGIFDLVLCRNVLIYFDLPSRKQILSSLGKTLAYGGYLLLGSSETTFSLDDSFARRSIDRAVFYCNQGSPHAGRTL